MKTELEVHNFHMIAPRFRSIALGISALILLGTAQPSKAESSYTYPAPPPARLAESNMPSERLAGDDQATVYGSWDFSYTLTPDKNIFVTRVFVVELDTVFLGMSVQTDCGRGMFRHLTAPTTSKKGSNEPATPITEIEVNSWLLFRRDEAFGRALMRTCEAAAEDRGVEWVWL